MLIPFPVGALLCSLFRAPAVEKKKGGMKCCWLGEFNLIEGLVCFLSIASQRFNRGTITSLLHEWINVLLLLSCQAKIFVFLTSVGH